MNSCEEMRADLRYRLPLWAPADEEEEEEVEEEEEEDTAPALRPLPLLPRAPALLGATRMRVAVVTVGVAVVRAASSSSSSSTVLLSAMRASSRGRSWSTAFPSWNGLSSWPGGGRTDGRGGHNAVRMCFSALPFYGGILFYLEAFYFIFFKCCCPSDKLSTAVFKVQFDNGWVDK